jgi:hypothetical protein
MTGYYRRLQKGEGRGEALRQIQLEMLMGTKLRHPYSPAYYLGTPSQPTKPYQQYNNRERLHVTSALDHLRMLSAKSSSHVICLRRQKRSALFLLLP